MRRRRLPALLAPALQTRAASLSLQANPTEAFALWQQTHGRSYKSTRDAAHRREVFLANAARVAEAGSSSYLSTCGHGGMCPHRLKRMQPRLPAKLSVVPQHPPAVSLPAQVNARPSGSLRLALNEFADLTWQEFSAARLGYKPDLK